MSRKPRAYRLLNVVIILGMLLTPLQSLAASAHQGAAAAISVTPRQTTDTTTWSAQGPAASDGGKGDTGPLSSDTAIVIPRSQEGEAPALPPGPPGVPVPSPGDIGKPGRKTRADSTVPAPDTAISPLTLTTESVDIPLVEGWNLISLPLVPADTSTTSVLSSIAGNYDLVYAYRGCDLSDPWKWFDANAPSFVNELTDLDESMGIWIRMLAAGTLTVSGTPPSTTSIPVCSGWNLIGYPDATSSPVANALATIPERYSLVYAYDAADSGDPWKTYDTSAPPVANDLTQMEPGNGYWVKVDYDNTVTIPPTLSCDPNTDAVISAVVSSNDGTAGVSLPHLAPARSQDTEVAREKIENLPEPEPEGGVHPSEALAPLGHMGRGSGGSKYGGGQPVPGNPSNGGGRDCRVGSTCNVADGSLRLSISTLPVPSKGGPLYMEATYDSRLDYVTPISTTFELIGDFPIVEQRWWATVAGRTFEGTGTDVDMQWDGLNAQGQPVRPGLYPVTVESESLVLGDRRLRTAFTDFVEVRQGAGFSFGGRWISNYDALLVDHLTTVTVVLPRLKPLHFTLREDGTYGPIARDAFTLILARRSDGAWTLRFRDNTEFLFNSLGQLVRSRDRNGNDVVMTYAVAQGSRPDCYPPTVMRAIIDNVGQTTLLERDADDRVTRIIDAAGRQYIYEYDAAGDLKAFTDPASRQTTYTYDAQHRLTDRTDPRGGHTTYTYDAEGRMISRTDPLTSTLSVSYRTDGSVLTDDRGNEWDYRTDRLGAVGQTSNSVQSVDYVRDGRNLMIQSDPPLTRYRYDDEGHLVEIVDHRLITATFESTFHQPISVRDGAGNVTNYQYDAKGNLVAMTDALGGVLQWSYDSAGLPITLTNQLSQTTSFAYDAQGNLTTLTDPLTNTTALAYDSAGNLTRLTDAEGRTTDYAYDAVDNLVAVTDTLSNATAYVYDANDNLTEVTDARGNKTTYTYDALDQLLSETDAISNTTRYTYDPNGNLSTRTDAIGATTTYTYGVANRLTGIGYPDVSTVTYAYNELDDLTRAANRNAMLTYDYDEGFIGNPSTVVISGTAGSPVSTTVTYDYVIPPGLAAASAARGARDAKRNPGPPKPPVTPDGSGPGIGQVSAPGTSRSTAANGPGKGPGKQVMSYESPYELIPYQAVPAGIQTDVSGDITVPVTWTLSSSPYVLTDNVTVSSGVTLTIEPGVQVQGTGGLIVNGHLAALGTATQPITFTRTGGGFPTDWITFPSAATGRLEHTTVRNAFRGIVLGDQCDVTIKDSTIAENDDVGLEVGINAIVRLEGSVIRDNGDSGVHTVGTVLASDTTIRDNGGHGLIDMSDVSLHRVVVSGNAGYGVYMGGAESHLIMTSSTIRDHSSTISFPLRVRAEDLAGVLAGGNVFTGNATTGLEVIGGTFSNTTLVNTSSINRYRIDGDATVPSEVMLSIEPGVAVELGGTLGVEGHLQAVGAPTRPITLTGSIQLKSGSRGRLEHAIVQNSAMRAIKATGSELEIRYSTITNNAEGIHASDSHVMVSQSTIAGNMSYGILNESSASPVIAENNWWGHASGPLHTSQNPGGQGNQVSDGVDFEPWLDAPPTVPEPNKSGLLYGVTIATPGNPTEAVQYRYDALNRLSSLISSGSASYTYQFTYDAASRLTQVAPSSGNPGVKTTMAYDAASRLTSLANQSPDVATVFNNFAYTYDRVGNVRNVTDSSPSAGSGQSGTTTYEYDDLYRLTVVTYPDASWERYAYDAVGNRTNLTRSVGITITYSYNAANQLTSQQTPTQTISYAYDANGNLHTKTDTSGTTTYSYDYENRLTRIDYPDGTHSAYTYDAFGRRLSKTDRTGNTIYYVYDGPNIVQEMDAGGNVIASYVHNQALDHPFSMTRGGTTYYYLYDRLGSVIGLTDGAGNLVASYAYDPWGNVLSETGGVENPFRYTGREWDAESALYYYRSRYYDPVVGRFTTEDSVSDLFSGSQELNRYAYVGNNPVNRVDPTGYSWRCFWKGLGEAAGVVAAGALAVAGVAALMGALPVAAGALAVAKVAGAVGVVTTAISAWDTVHDYLTGQISEQEFYIEQGSKVAGLAIGLIPGGKFLKGKKGKVLAELLKNLGGRAVDPAIAGLKTIIPSDRSTRLILAYSAVFALAGIV